MCRVAMSFLSRSSTRQPSISGRQMSRVMASRLVLAGHRQRGGAQRGDQPLEALLARGLEQELANARSFSTISSTRIAGLDVVAVVADLVDELGGLEDRRGAACGSAGRGTGLAGRRSVGWRPPGPSARVFCGA